MSSAIAIPSHPLDYDVVIESRILSPAISVITAIHDMEKNGFLLALLASFEAQGCFDCVEYVLVDDCSEDASLALACEWAKGRNDTTVIHLHKNMKQGAARNRAIWEAKGERFAIVDADDVVSPDYVKCIVDAIDNTCADAIIPHWIQLTDNLLNPLGEPYRNLQTPEAVGMVDEDTMRKIIIHHWQFGVWPRRLFEDKSNWYLEGMFYEDTPVGIRWILQLNSIAEASGGTYFYRQNPNSTVHTTHMDKQKLEDRLISSIAILDLTKTLGSYELYKPELDWYFLQVEYFNTISGISRGQYRSEYVKRLKSSALNRVDLFSNPYYRLQPLLGRLHKRFMWKAPKLYCYARRVLLYNSYLNSFLKKAMRK